MSGLPIAACSCADRRNRSWRNRTGPNFATASEMCVSPHRLRVTEQRRPEERRPERLPRAGSTLTANSERFRDPKGHSLQTADRLESDSSTVRTERKQSRSTTQKSSIRGDRTLTYGFKWISVHKAMSS
jgi:hypothetical protein